MLKELKDKIRKIIVSDYAALFSKDTLEENKLREIASHVLEDIISGEHISISDEDKKSIINDTINEFIGYGPIDNLLKDPTVTEIMVNGPGKVYVERSGRKELTSIVFDNEQQVMWLIHKILAPTRRRVDESYPYTDVSMKDGARVNIIIPPLSINGPTVTIRKFTKEIGTVEDLIKLGTLDKRLGDFLVACIKAKANIIFAGATGAGKTTTLGVLSSYINNEERIITIEDTAELHLNQEHVVRLETRQPNIEGKGEVSIRDMFKNSLRMRPERIIIGEIRGNEAFDMLQAICSGHSGSLAVIHANSPEDVIYRIEAMLLISGVPISLEAIHRQIAAAINLIIQQERLSDGSRRITHITQTNGLNNGRVILQDLFLYEMENIDSNGKINGKWKATGALPSFCHLFKKANINLEKETFDKG